MTKDSSPVDDEPQRETRTAEAEEQLTLEDENKRRLRAHNSGCATAALLTFVGPMLVVPMIMIAGPMVCLLIIFLPIVGGIWGLALLATGARDADGNRINKTPDTELNGTDRDGRPL